MVDFHLGYTPFAVNYFDAYHVVEDGMVTDIWPILPRGPLDHGLLAMLEAGALTRMPDVAAGSSRSPDEAPRELVVATYWVGVAAGR